MQIFVRHGLARREDRSEEVAQEHVEGFQGVSSNDTVDSLMKTLSRTWSRPIPNSSLLMCNGRCLRDGKRTLGEYGVEECSVIQLGCCSLQGGMMIKVKTLTGKEIEIDIEPSDTVERIKERVEEKEGIPPVQQRLIFAGKQMNDDKMAKEYHVEGGSVLHLVLALRGG